jgi:hypothetical protein
MTVENATEPAAEFSMLIIGRELVIVARKKRSKWYEIHCPGCSQSKRRKDGSCKHERIAIECVSPAIRSKARITHTPAPSKSPPQSAQR